MVQSNSVITNSLRVTKFVLYNRVVLCTKLSFGTEYFIRYNRMFYCIPFLSIET